MNDACANNYCWHKQQKFIVGSFFQKCSGPCYHPAKNVFDRYDVKGVNVPTRQNVYPINVMYLFLAPIKLFPNRQSLKGARNNNVESTCVEGQDRALAGLKPIL